MVPRSKTAVVLRLAALLIPVAWGVAWIFSKGFYDYPPGNDSCLYLTMAKGFAEGTGYHDVTSPDPAAGTLQCPSLWPLVLSLYWRLPHPDLESLKWANALILSLAAVPCFFWLRLFLSAVPAFLIVSAFACSWATVFLGNSFMTETVFTPLLYLGLFASYRGWENGGTGPGAGLWRWASVILWTMTARTRVVGWFFWGTCLFLLGRRKEWPKVAAGMSLAAAWLWMERSMASGIHVTHYQDGVFTGQYPILVHPLAGLAGLFSNLWATLWNWASAGQAHALFPYLYYVHPMDKAKRAVCLLIFSAVVWGIALLWRSRRETRPWLLAILAANIPTFVIFHPEDAWRYMHPYLPIACLFLMLAVQWLAGRAINGRAAAVGVGMLLVFCQAMHTWRRDMTDDYIDQSGDFRALHDSLEAMDEKPALLLSPDHYYTWLRTGIPSMNDYGRQHRLPQVIPYLRDRETWAIVGSANAYYVEPWLAAGMRLDEPPKSRVGQWTVNKAEWEGDRRHEPGEDASP